MDRLKSCKKYKTITSICNTMLKLVENSTQDRVIIPVLKTIDLLLQKGCLVSLNTAGCEFPSKMVAITRQKLKRV